MVHRIVVLQSMHAYWEQWRECVNVITRYSLNFIALYCVQRVVDLRIFGGARVKSVRVDWLVGHHAQLVVALTFGCVKDFMFRRARNWIVHPSHRNGARLETDGT
jgi:hypothetical protein